MPTKGHPGPTGLGKCSVTLSPPRECLRDSQGEQSPSLDSTASERREEHVPASPDLPLPPPSPSELQSWSPNSPSSPLLPHYSPTAHSSYQQQPLPSSSPAPPLPAPPSREWPFPNSDEVIECLCCDRDGNSGNMFVGNFAIARHIVDYPKEFCKCAHCKCSLPDEDGVFIAHMKECEPCPGFPRCPFEAHQCPFLSENTDTPSEYCAAALD